MPTQPRSSAEHYGDAERLLAATQETPANAPLLALCHALLSTAPRRALRAPPARHGNDGLPPHLSWGDDQASG